MHVGLWKACKKELLGRTRPRGQDDNEMYFSEMESENVDWTHLAHDAKEWLAVVNTVMNLRIP